MHSILEIQQLSRPLKSYQIKTLTVPDVLIMYFWLYLITYVSVCGAIRARPVFSTIHSILDWLKLDSRERCPLAIGYQRLSKVEYPQSVHERNHFDPDFRHDLSPQWLFECLSFLQRTNSDIIRINVIFNVHPILPSFVRRDMDGSE